MKVFLINALCYSILFGIIANMLFNIYNLFAGV